MPTARKHMQGEKARRSLNRTRIPESWLAAHLGRRLSRVWWIAGLAKSHYCGQWVFVSLMLLKKFTLLTPG